MTNPLDRRDLLKRMAAGLPAVAAVGVAAAPAQPAKPAAATPRPQPVAAPRPRAAWRFLKPDEAALLDAVAARLIPNDELGPGAKEAGTTRFIDEQLAGPFGAGHQLYLGAPFQAGTPQQGYQLSYAPREMFRLGLAKLQQAARAAHGQAFDQLTAPQQDALLHHMEAGELDFSPLPSKVFFTSLFDAVQEAFFADPLYGGNQGMAGWKLVGFPGAYASYANEIERHNVPWTRPPVAIGNAPKMNMSMQGSGPQANNPGSAANGATNDPNATAPTPVHGQMHPPADNASQPGATR